MADYEAEVQMRIEELAEGKWKAEADRERIEFIRRAYLARLATVARPEDLSAYDEKGDGYQGRWALRYLAEQDWEAVREL